jgi:hypothetical protein
MSGAGPVFRTAVEDLENLPGDAWEKEAAHEMLVARCAELGQNPSGLGEEEQDFLMSTQPLVQEWKQRIRQEARLEWEPSVRGEALEQGLRTGLLETYRARFGTVPPAVESTLRHVHDPDKLTRWFPLFSTKSAEEIADVLRIAKNGSASPG